MEGTGLTTLIYESVSSGHILKTLPEESEISASMGSLYTKIWLYMVQRTAYSAPLTSDGPTGEERK